MEEATSSLRKKFFAVFIVIDKLSLFLFIKLFYGYIRLISHFSMGSEPINLQSLARFLSVQIDILINEFMLVIQTSDSLLSKH